jgi:Golgi apparatus protein 1
MKINHFSLFKLRLLLKISDASEDIRVDAHLQQSCQNLLTGPCKDVQPGEGRVIKCLVKFIGSSTISEDCEERLLQIQFFVARDWS